MHPFTLGGLRSRRGQHGCIRVCVCVCVCACRFSSVHPRQTTSPHSCGQSLSWLLTRPLVRFYLHCVTNSDLDSVNWHLGTWCLYCLLWRGELGTHTHTQLRHAWSVRAHTLCTRARACTHTHTHNELSPMTPCSLYTHTHTHMTD